MRVSAAFWLATVGLRFTRSTELAVRYQRERVDLEVADFARLVVQALVDLAAPKCPVCPVCPKWARGRPDGDRKRAGRL